MHIYIYIYTLIYTHYIYIYMYIYTYIYIYYTCWIELLGLGSGAVFDPRKDAPVPEAGAASQIATPNHPAKIIPKLRRLDISGNSLWT